MDCSPRCLSRGDIKLGFPSSCVGPPEVVVFLVPFLQLNSQFVQKTKQTNKQTKGTLKSIATLFFIIIHNYGIFFIILKNTWIA